MFVDEKVVTLKAGNGGDGCASFRREKFIPKGGPNGGDGGDGGDIVLECDTNITDLTVYHFKSNWAAGNAEAGKGNQKYGANGKDCVLKLPAGTIVYDIETERPVAELVEHGQRIVLIKGGKGGLGNVHFKSSTNRAPRQFTHGVQVPEQKFKFVLKVIADIGLVGYPNAGKSSLTNLITKAHPKTAPYPFTTKNPIIGVIEYPETYERLRL
ncbi:MAG: GTPase Obg, partial [Verrucomicrobia bacterium]